MASTNNDNEKIDTSNIFEELGDNPGLKDEVNQIMKSQNKDVYYYLEKIGHYLQLIFGFSLLLLIVFSSYIYIQKNENLSNNNLIDPFCFLILGDIQNTNTYCSSIASLNKEYLSKLESIKQTQISDINLIIDSLYKLENFNKSKDVNFLRKKSKSKLPVLTILDEFDSLKNEFESIEKEKIKCFDIEINSEYILNAKCEAFSSGFDKEIKGFDGTDRTLVGGKSISYANSFLNFIEKQSTNFIHVNKQKVFSQENLLGERTGFTSKTSFKLELKYKNSNIF